MIWFKFFHIFFHTISVFFFFITYFLCFIPCAFIIFYTLLHVGAEMGSHSMQLRFESRKVMFIVYCLLNKKWNPFEFRAVLFFLVKKVGNVQKINFTCTFCVTLMGNRFIKSKYREFFQIKISHIVETSYIAMYLFIVNHIIKTSNTLFGFSNINVRRR